jgi:hypothetical protein
MKVLSDNLLEAVSGGTTTRVDIYPRLTGLALNAVQSPFGSTITYTYDDGSKLVVRASDGAPLWAVGVQGTWTGYNETACVTTVAGLATALTTAHPVGWVAGLIAAMAAGVDCVKNQKYEADYQDH